MKNMDIEVKNDLSKKEHLPNSNYILNWEEGYLD